MAESADRDTAKHSAQPPQSTGAELAEHALDESAAASPSARLDGGIQPDSNNLTSIISRADAATQTRLISRLQRTQGNAFVQRLLARGRRPPSESQPPAVVGRMESAFGMSFQDVELRTDEAAAARADTLDAKAYTDGKTIGFARGEFAPDTREGLRTIAHEFAHVVQSRGGTGGRLPARSIALGPGSPRLLAEQPDEDERLDPIEADAEAAAAAVVDGEQPTVALATLDREATAPKTRSVTNIPRGGYRVFQMPDGGFTYVFNVQDVKTWSDPRMELFSWYVRDAFPGAGSSDAQECAGVVQPGWEGGPLDPKSIPDSLDVAPLAIRGPLHKDVVAWFRANRPRIKPSRPPEGYREFEQAGKGGGGGKGAEPGTGLSESSSGAESQGLLKLQQLYDYLFKTFPDHPIFKEDSATLEDLIGYVAKQGAPAAAMAGKFESITPEQWRAFLDKWRAGKGLAGTTGGIAGGAEGVIKFEPQGGLVLMPKVEKYVKGAELRAKVEFRAGHWYNAMMNAFPRKAAFDWSVINEADGKVADTGPIFEGRGDIDYAFKLQNTGRYTVKVHVTSEYFVSGVFDPEPISITVSEEGQREQEVFQQLLVGPQDDLPFELVGGRLQLKSAVGPLTVEGEKLEIHKWIGAIDALLAKGEISTSEAENAKKILTERLAMLDEKQDSLKGSQPYPAFGTFLDRTSSAYTKLKVMLYVETVKEGPQISCKARLIDSTLAPDKPPEYSGEGTSENTGDENSARSIAERVAIARLGDFWTHNNDYPDGTVHLGIKLSDGSIFQWSFDTYNVKKPIKRGAGYVALGAGVVALGASAFTGETTAPVGVVALETGAGLVATGAALTDVALRVEQRIANKTFGADRETAMDALQVVSSAVGLGGMARAIATGQRLANGYIMIGMKITTLGADVGQAVLLTAEVQKQIDLAEEECTVKLTQATTEEEKQQIRAQRDVAIAHILGGAAVNGGFMLVSLGKGIKEVTTPGFLRPKANAEPTPYVVRESIAELGASGDAGRIRATLDAPDPLMSKQEIAYLEEALWHASGGGDVLPKTGGQPAKTAKGPKPAETPPAPEARGGGSTPAGPPAEHGTTKYPAGLVEHGLTPAEARRSYNASLEANPHDEVAIYVDTQTGEHIVVQGERAAVTTEWAAEPGLAGRSWELVEHFHPGDDMAARYASEADFQAMMHPQLTGQAPPGKASTQVRWRDPRSKIQFLTEIGYEPAQSEPYYIRYRDAQGQWQTKRFADTPWNAGSDYKKFLQAEGVPVEGLGSATPGPKAAGEPGKPEGASPGGTPEPQKGVEPPPTPRSSSGAGGDAAASGELNALREKLSPEAQKLFDAERQRFASDKGFLDSIKEKTADPQKMYEALAKRQAAPPAPRPTDADLAAARQQLDQAGFKPDRGDIAPIVARGDRDALRGKIAEELAKIEVQTEFKDQPGHEVFTGVRLGEEMVGAKTADEALALYRTETGVPTKGDRFGFYEAEGKWYRKLGELDIMVLGEPGADGKRPVARVEQIKAGQGKLGAARKQIKENVEAFERIQNGESRVQVHLKGTPITSQIDAGSVTADVAVARGPAGTQSPWDKKLPLTENQITTLASDMLNQPKGGGSP